MLHICLLGWKRYVGYSKKPDRVGAFLSRLPVLICFAEITTHGSIVHIMTRRHHPWHQVPSIKHQVPSIKHQAPSTKHQARANSEINLAKLHQAILCAAISQMFRSWSNYEKPSTARRCLLNPNVLFWRPSLSYNLSCWLFSSPWENITKSLLAKSLHVPHATEIKGGD